MIEKSACGLTRRQLQQRGQCWGVLSQLEQRAVELEQQHRVPRLQSKGLFCRTVTPLKTVTAVHELLWNHDPHRKVKYKKWGVPLVGNERGTFFSGVDLHEDL
jgi:hypothetical protein